MSSELFYAVSPIPRALTASLPRCLCDGTSATLDTGRSDVEADRLGEKRGGSASWALISWGSATMTPSRHRAAADGRLDLYVLRTMPVKPAMNRAARAPVSSCSPQVL
jgi:hypothetical protein